MLRQQRLAIFAAPFILCGAAFADTVYLKNGDVIENAVITDVTQTEIKYRVGKRAVVYTISKNDALKITYDNGGEDVFGADAQTAGLSGAYSAEAKNEVEKDDAAGTDHPGSRFVRKKLTGQPVEALDRPVTRIDTAYYRLYAGYSSRGVGLLLYNDNLIRRLYARGRLLYPPPFIIGYSVGISWKTLIDVGYDMRFRFPLPTDYHSQITFGFGSTIGIFGGDALVAYAGYQYEKWLFELGYSFGGSYYDEHDIKSSLLLRAGMDFNTITEKKIKDKDRKRVFRGGFELNYPVWRSDIDYFENEFPYMAGGAGLFFRIGPEPVYFSTGIYGKLDILYRGETTSLSFLGIPLATLPLMDIYWTRVFTEVPLLLNFGTGQIRFTGGALLDFYVTSQININILDQRVISANDIERIEERIGEIPAGIMYWSVGLDFDIVKYWGIGVKFLIHNHSFGEPDSDYSRGLYQPNEFQVRVSTYLVF